jgi:dipeptide transport system permease protein
MSSDLRSYIVRRVMMVIPVLLGVSILIFSVVQLFSPVERASLFIRSEREASNVAGIIRKYGLDQPIHIQYISWLSEVLRGNLGWSKVVSRPVLEALLTFLPATVELTIYAAPLTIILGIYLGKKAAVHKDKAIDHLTRTLAIVGWSMPTFWLAIMLLAIFYGYTGGIFPPDRLSVEAAVYVQSPQFTRYTGINTIDALLNGQLWVFVDALRHIVLPTLTLVTVQVALLMRVMRSSMLEALGQGYVLAARAKGLDERTVVDKHAGRNAMIPVITLSGLLVASMLNGVVITETVFNYKGVGWWFVRAASQLDIPSVLGFSMFAAVLFVMANLIVDILYAYIDPRIRLT